MTEEKPSEEKEKNREDEEKGTEAELPFCTTGMGPEQARGADDNQPCDDYRDGDYTREEAPEG